jgi:DNA-binding NarL/FixJ family response regulator
LLALGHTNREIAEELYISPTTASAHVTDTLTKLQADNRSQAAYAARRMRLFSHESSRTSLAGVRSLPR